jgi:SAM-dependent methyltransferase
VRVGSLELETHIRDWPSEYHLSAKRARLFSGFEFERSSRVLEVGCGCGAITRYLGETFEQVVAIEGSVVRARLARLRTRDLTNVDIVCAPFQDLRFKARFDIIFCVGVLEYSPSFVEAADPFENVLECFANWLAPGGVLVVAIENQFGLKYFNGFREDHLGERYAGLEGYHTRVSGPRTFGRQELQQRLERRFPVVEFFYPYPDYKLPSCLVSHAFLASDRAAELVTQSASRDYHSATHGLWDEELVSAELARNRTLPFFANSFLAFASVGDRRLYCFPQDAIFHSSDRLQEFRTVTRVTLGSGESATVCKALANGEPSVQSGPLTLRAVQSNWISGRSLHARILQRCHRRDSSLNELFHDGREWGEALRAKCTDRNGEQVLSGRFVDAIWANCFVGPEGTEFIDQEWEWDGSIKLSVLTIRAIYEFLCRVEGKAHLHDALAARSGRTTIKRIAAAVGVPVTSRDFSRFVALQAEIQARIWGADRKRSELMLWWYLIDRRSMFSAMRIKGRIARGAQRIMGVLRSGEQRGRGAD